MIGVVKCLVGDWSAFGRVLEWSGAYAAVAIYGGETGGDAAPCGACRQFMLEFADEALEAPLFFAGRDGSFVTSSFQEICPYPFRSFAGND